MDICRNINPISTECLDICGKKIHQELRFPEMSELWIYAPTNLQMADVYFIKGSGSSRECCYMCSLRTHLSANVQTLSRYCSKIREGGLIFQQMSWHFRQIQYSGFTFQQCPCCGCIFLTTSRHSNGTSTNCHMVGAHFQQCPCSGFVFQIMSQH